MATTVLPDLGSVPPFLVTGSGRCGTHYLAAVLNELGIATGHESVFAYDESHAGAWGTWRGDCSWPGAAYAHRLPAGCPVLHLVRDPLAMVRSRLGDNNLAETFPPRTVVGFVERHRPWIFDGATDDVGRVLLFVSRWNRAVEDLAGGFPRLPFRRERVEDLSADPEHLADVVEFLAGAPVDPDTCRPVLAGVDRSTGSRGHRVALEWDDVRAHPNGAELLALAVDYGYPTA